MTPEFQTWRVLMARGPICRRWRAYPNFRRDTGPKPSWRHLLIRADPTAEFSPGNCRWQVARWYLSARSSARTR
jgi:hypothetical protein